MPIVIRQEPIQSVKARKLSELDAAREAAETAAVTVRGKPFPATKDFGDMVSDAVNQIGRGKPIDMTDAWRDKNHAPVAMNAALLGQIEDAITQQKVAAWRRYWTLFDAVQAAQTAEAVNAVTW